MTSRRQKSSRKPVLAAGGIVIAAGHAPLIAVVQRRKDDAWVLPKGKLKPKESARAAAQREVMEETGHRVTVHEFLGAVSYQSRGKPKVAQFWRMARVGKPRHEPLNDIKAVEWLPLNAAVARLSQPLEQVFLARIGQQALAQRRRALPRKAPKAGGKALRSAKSFDTWRHRQAATRRRLAAAKNGHEQPAAAADKPIAVPGLIRRLYRRLQSAKPPAESTAPPAS
jgi:8-oxo-dGTP diphosphatase